MSLSDLVIVRQDGPVALVTINRPEKRNALDRALVDALAAEIARLGRDDGVRALVLTGAGEKAFVAGADIAELRERGAAEALAGINASLFLAVEEFPWPVVAAIRGWALGGGLELALACDIRVAGESARFGQPELMLGILPAAGGLHRLPAIVGSGVARDLVFTGRVIDAGEALRLGLVTHVVPDGEVVDRAMEVARQAASMAPDASRLAKRVMNALTRPRPDTAITLESAAQAVLFESDEKRRRMTAFLNRKATRRADRASGARPHPSSSPLPSDP